MQVRSTRDSAPPVRYWERSVNSASLPRNSASESHGESTGPCLRVRVTFTDQTNPDLALYTRVTDVTPQD